MRSLAAILLAALLFTQPALAATAPQDPQSRPEVAAVEAYLNSITTMKARFIQTANDGKQVAGTFMLKRPGRLRFEYDPPLKDLIVADGLMIHYYDSQMKQDSATLISKSLADFFLRPDLQLGGDLMVTDVRRADKLLMITLVQVKDQSAGSLTLGLTEKPALTLKKWRVVDSQGGVTEVELFDPETGIKLDHDLFHYYDPEHGNPKYN